MEHRPAPTTGLVAFLDILGFSAAVCSDWPGTLYKLLNIKGAEGVKTDGITFAVEGPEASPNFRPAVNTFSDSIILVTALQIDRPPLEQLIAFISTARNIGFAWNAAVKEGFLLRGAIEFGDIYRSESDVVGPAVASAVNLEKRADSGRILLGPKLLRALYELDGKTEYGSGWLSTLMKCRADDLIAVSPAFFASTDDDTIEKIEGMRSCASDDKAKRKYDELLEMLKDTPKIIKPGFSDLIGAARDLERPS
jgi:hypothetical protein